MNKNGIYEMADGVYQIRYYYLGAADVYMYLVIGKEKALLIDTGYASTRVKQYVDQVTDLPLIVVNTHGHMDHIGGNRYFAETYISAKELETAKRHSESTFLKEKNEHIFSIRPALKGLLKDEKYVRELVENEKGQDLNCLDLPETGYFDLGERIVSFIETPGHTQGSICLHDEKTNILFSADTLCSKGVLLGFEESTGVKEFKDTLIKMASFCKDHEICKIYPCHHDFPLTADMIDEYIVLCDQIINKKIEGTNKDTGTCDGFYVSDGKISLIYKRI